MNFLSLIPFISCVACLVLLSIAAQKSGRSANKVLAYFLFTSFAWGLFSFILSSDPSPSSSYLMFWNRLIVVAAACSFASYYHFARVYTDRRAGILTYCGYCCVVLALILSFIDIAFFSSPFAQNTVSWSFMMMAILLPMVTCTIVLFVKKYQVTKDPAERNKIVCLTAGLGIAAVYTLTIPFIRATAYLPVDHLGSLTNALIVSFVIRRYKLPGVGIILRRALAYCLLALIVVGILAGGFYAEEKYAQFMPLYAILIASGLILVLMHILIRRLRHIFEEKIDRIFCPDTYAHRQVLLEFSSKIANTLDLDGVANEVLSTIVEVLRITHAELLFKIDGNYVAQFVYPRDKAEAISILILKKDSSIPLWLAKEGEPLSVAGMSNITGLKQVATEDNSELSNARLGQLLPIKGRESMIGILALGNRQNGDVFNNEDLELAMAIVKQAGIVIENAQLYEQAKQRANIDELTGLFNHRHFHERLFEEVSRSSRFGDVFSLLMIDLDCFKSYNDIHGHLHGDNILRKVGEIVRSNVRAVDVAARYGGDEFSIILPKTSIDSSLRIADRLRTAMESEFDSEGISITCSIGVASWPTDGIMKEALIHAADSALYHAKKTGRNLVFTASKLATLNITDRPKVQENNDLILDTIYALAATVDAKDHYTYGHSNKVSKYACDIATDLGYSEERIKVIRIAGLLHDIGKIGVSDDILGKNTGLDDNEWKPIHAHPSMGVSILKHIDSIKECLPGVLYHHERYDGTGYPQGLKGENIPLDARILSVADSYDAMTSSRCYRDSSWDSGRAIEELIRCSGTQFDPGIVEVFAKILAKTPRKNTRFVFTHTNP